MPASVNMRSPTIKRILQEMKEIKQAMADEPDACPFAAEGEFYFIVVCVLCTGISTMGSLCTEFVSIRVHVAMCHCCFGSGHQPGHECAIMFAALEDDVYQWCFCIRGPADSPFSKGIYHGRILLPPEYPFKPPSFIMLTPVAILTSPMRYGRLLFISAHRTHSEPLLGCAHPLDKDCVLQSGRFETNTKICLSISSYHPEQWQPSWSMRTALTALIAFFPSPAKGAVGSQEAPDSERALMALESRLVSGSQLLSQTY